MSYTFRIHKDTPGTVNGWNESSKGLEKGSGEGIATIEDSIDGGNAGKVGTSIPTPFARIYLFETAFQFVIDRANGNGSSNKVSFYDYLVTEALDLLQFIFERGGDSRLRIYEWDGINQIDELNKKGIKEGHKALARTLNLSLSANSPLQNIKIIEYDGIVIGGTSPFTLTYTSPNAIRLLNEKNVSLVANDKSQLFKERQVKHLKDRSKDFQKYVYWLVMKQYNSLFVADNTPLNTFYDYFSSQGLNYLKDEFKDDEAKYYDEVSSSSVNGREVRLSVYNGLTLRVNNAPLNLSDSDFLMNPSVMCFGKGPVPIVLPTDGDSAFNGWKYTEGDRWTSKTRVSRYQIEGYDVGGRFLPINGAEDKFTTHKYPWLTTSDFFEDSLIDLSFNLNREKFLFPECGDVNSRYLLPIRKEYFKYFTVEDLENNLRCSVKYKESSPSIVESISFELKVALKNRDYGIMLRRTYTKPTPRSGQIPDFPIVTPSQGMSFGVFPFYRCKGKDDKKNEYSVYLFSSAEKTGSAVLKFYRQDVNRECLAVADGSAENEDRGIVRTTEEKGVGYSKVYTLRNEISNSFDLIEVTLSEDKKFRGIAIPLWEKVPAVNGNKESIISIDFGTSNTYVAYLDENQTPQPLTIGEEDQQMVLLNGSSTVVGSKDRKQYRFGEDFGKAQAMPQYLREFVPSIIGHEGAVAKNEVVEYPIKTATLEKCNFSANDTLFAGINIGFNIDNEQIAFDSSKFSYKTNLKWNAENHKVKNEFGQLSLDTARINAFCDQTLWMLKNKLILSGNSSKIKMVYFYPDSMSEVGKGIFKESWENACKKIFSNRGIEVELKGELEAIAPFYSLLQLSPQQVYNRSAASIDIGGGTTDYFLLDQSLVLSASGQMEVGHAYEASVFFAGNDLWGETYPNGKDNGFVEYMRHKVTETPSEAQKLYRNYDKNKSMSDLSGFFFKNDDLFHFSELVRNLDKFRYVIFLHYASIIYYFANLLKYIRKENPSYRYPNVLTYTGKGSEYIKMLSPEPDKVSEMTFHLLRAFGLTDLEERVEIIFFPNPKALTADGGIYESMSNNSDLKINLYDVSEYGAKKVEGKTNMPYTRLTQRCIGIDQNDSGYRKKDVIGEEVAKRVMDCVEVFINAIYSDELESTRTFLKLTLSDEDRHKFLEYAKESYVTYSGRFSKNTTDSEAPLDENVFFFALKNTLIQLSSYYYDNYYSK